jgi:hypothetical protein
MGLTDIPCASFAAKNDEALAATPMKQQANAHPKEPFPVRPWPK